MARVTVEEVERILPTGTSLIEDQIQGAIDAATVVVDEVAAGCGSNLSAAALKQVEIYLSAHYCAATENTLSLSHEKSPGCSASVIYGFEFGEGVKGTPFGQMANTLSGGCLAEQDKSVVGFFSIGSHGDSA